MDTDKNKDFDANCGYVFCQGEALENFFLGCKVNLRSGG